MCGLLLQVSCCISHGCMERKWEASTGLSGILNGRLIESTSKNNTPVELEYKDRRFVVTNMSVDPLDYEFRI